MKLAVGALAAIAATVVLALPAGAAPPGGGPKNPSFEQGFAQWTTTVPPGAFALIISGQVRQGGGTRYAQLWTDGPGGGASIDQTYPAFAGSQIIGFARFNDGEGGACIGFDDSALITVDGNPVFEASTCTTSSTGAVVWTYTHTTTGMHTIHGEVQNGTDDIVDSTLDMDAPLIYKVTP